MTVRAEPYWIDQRVYMAIKRHLWRQSRVTGGYPYTIGEFRALSDKQILAFQQVGPVLAAAIRHVRDTWSDEALRIAFGMLPIALELSLDGACNWVGEGVPA